MTFTDFFAINCPSCRLQRSDFWDTLHVEHLLCINSVLSWREKIVLKHGKIRRVKFSRLDCSHFTNTEASSQRETKFLEFQKFKLNLYHEKDKSRKKYVAYPRCAFNHLPRRDGGRSKSSGNLFLCYLTRFFVDPKN